MLQINHGTDIVTQVTQEKNFRKHRDCRIPSVNTVFPGSESPQNWKIAPVKIN